MHLHVHHKRQVKSPCWKSPKRRSRRLKKVARVQQAAYCPFSVLNGQMATHLRPVGCRGWLLGLV